MRSVAAGRLLRGIRLATLLVTAVSLVGFALPLLVSGGAAHRSTAQQVVAFGLLAAVTLVAGRYVVLDRPPGRLRWVLLGLVVAGSVLAVTGVRAEYLLSEFEWSYGLIGWFGLLVLLDLGAPAACAFLAGHVVASFGYTAAVGQDAGGLVVVTVLVLGYQLPVVAATAVVRRLVDDAALAARREEEARLGDAVARRRHEDHKARCAALLPTVLPLLADLAAGDADLADDRVRARYAVEAARVRRLFAEHDRAPDPLAHELLACVELAERRGVVVQVELGDGRPQPPAPARRSLVDAVSGVLATARTSARVVVLGTPSAVTVSVVADGTNHGPVPVEDPASIAVTSLVEGERVWVEATWGATR